ncbi:MAG: AAA family ATPase [Candidatus Limivicinus sp.]|jgi:cytidylate kinase
MKIITISREFGSGGRELGKRLSDYLGFDYYDREIITTIAGNKGLDEGYVAHALENHGWQMIPLTYNSSFASFSMLSAQTDLLLEQRRVIESIAELGNDCIIVGRNADVILESYHPFNIFVCADMEARIKRCMERAPKNENLSRRDMERKIKLIDKNRAQTRDIIAEGRWGECDSYHLTVNTTDWNIKTLTPAVAAFAKSWFERED